MEVRTFRLYTGAPRGARIPTQGPGLLQAAHPAQELLEHQVLLHLRGTGGLSAAHPLGIAWTMPLPDRTRVHLDHVALDSPDRAYSIARLALERLLPFQGPDGLPTDCPPRVPGLRVARVDNVGLHLTLADHPDAHVVLTGPSPQGWRTELAEHEAGLVESGRQPLWNRPELTTAEARWQQQNPLRPWTWAGAGLLRRVGLLASVSTAYSVHFWDRGDDTLCFEMRHLHPALPAHGRLADRLLDTGWGMPVRIEDEHCDCRHSRADRPHTHDDTYERACHLTLVHRDGRPGRIQLRFTSSSARAPHLAGARLTELRDELTRAGAPRRWLRRVLPAPPTPARPAPSLPARRAACTGESLTEASAAITAADSRAYPDASFPQMRLESDIALALHGLWGRTRNPFAIRTARPQPDRLTLDIEPATGPYWAALLPRDHGSNGIPGLRHRTHPDGIHLLRHEDGEPPARIVLTGLPPAQWQRALTQAPPPLDAEAWSATETARHQDATDRAQEHYVGSGLLRMAAAQRGPAATTSTRLSCAPTIDDRGRKRWQWQLDLSWGPDHDSLLDLLTDTALTLGLELWNRTCTCRQARPKETGCTMTLHDCGQVLVVRDHRFGSTPSPNAPGRPCPTADRTPG
ncbi:hypothetical protein PUR61_17005 [Streptomyces sp. BE20]|uniref:hypothetical protein n=1 Tax=Streptomyces sp. BE20 TaxID=3002525 RepID=UPI002E790447|nr:hypothetical protein [Streptomyces sp. BE20]MEE1823877.1 hypothetical protein [Streptomyces sp. BE20]